ncbi:MAG: AI-2E family transporter [Bacteroidetes bacterium]|nr:AI-2E family transporter [Bacteroidota bacterium]
MPANNAISNKPLIKVILILGLIIFCFWIASFFPDLVLTVIISTLAAFILKPLVRYLEYRFSLKRWFAITIIFVLAGGLTTLILIETIPLLIGRIRLIYSQLQNFPIEEKLTITAKEIASNLPFVDPSTLGDKVHLFIQQLIGTMGEATGTIASYLVNLLIIPFITYFILAEGDIGIKKFVEKIPNKYFEMSLNIMNKLQRELVAYLRGLIIECSLVGVLSTIGFIIIGVPYAVLIGILCGIANLVPYLGFITGASIAILASLVHTGDFRHLLWIFVLTGIVRLIDDIILQPICFGKSLNMHPVAVVLTLIIGHQLMGIAGMIISIPVATVLRVSAKETYWGLKNYTITA